MAGRISTIVLLILFSVLLVWAGSARAGVEPCPWSVPLASGFDNPIFWVLFNPQPEPPGDEMVPMSLDISVPTAPVFKVNNSSDGKFHLEFAIQDLSFPVSGFQFLPGTRGFEVSTLGSAGPVYTATFTFESGGGFLTPGSDVMFNPQPEPPGLPGVLVSYSLVDSTTGAPPLVGSEVAMTLQLSGPGGELISLSPVIAPFIRGDANADGTPDMSDAVTILGFLFLGSTMNDCMDAADVNDDGEVDISDPVSLLGFLFLGSKQPPAPFTACGGDTTGDGLDCKMYDECP